MSGVQFGNDARQVLHTGVNALSLPPLTADQEERFALYAELLLAYTEKVNLTAIREPVLVASKHFIDSLSLLRLITLAPGLKLIDIGTGAGFPGVPLLIMQPEIQLTLLDSQAKRLTFLKSLLQEIGLRAELVHRRAEEAAHLVEHRAAYDIATARGVASLPRLLEICLPFLKPGGLFCAQKGPSVDAELVQAKDILKQLRGTLQNRFGFSLRIDDENTEERVLLLFRQVGKPPAIFPQPPSKRASKKGEPK